MDVAYGSRKPRLDTRLEGKCFDCTAGDSTHFYNFSYESPITKVLFNGVETFAKDANMGDSVTLWTEYYAGPTYEWITYKKFGKNYMVFPNTIQKNILFPTEPILGVRMAIKYNNTGTETVKFAINLFNFVDRQTVNPAVLQEGHDW